MHGTHTGLVHHVHSAHSWRCVLVCHELNLPCTSQSSSLIATTGVQLCKQTMASTTLVIPPLTVRTVCALLCAGLDSFAALSVMGYLQDLAASTCQTVIATIHQPRSAIWGMFDNVMFTGTRMNDKFSLCAPVLQFEGYNSRLLS